MRILAATRAPEMALASIRAERRFAHGHLRGIDYCFHFITLEANEHANDPCVGDTELVIYRIKLTIEGHSILAIRTQWPPVITDRARWRATELMPSTDLLTSPLEPGKLASLIGHGFVY